VPVQAARRSLLPAILLCVAFALASMLPATASANRAGRASAASASNREQRQAERSARHEARQAQREARASEREATRAARLREREAHRAARTEHSNVTEAPLSTEQPPAEAKPEGKPEAPAGEGAQPVAASAPGCSLTVAASAALLTAGESATLTGKLSCPTAAEAEGRELTIEQRQAPGGGDATASSTLAPAGNVKTATDGSYEFHTVSLATRSTFVIRSADTRHPARIVVRVNAGVTLQGPAASGASFVMGAGRLTGGSNRTSFSGIVQPASADVAVGLRVRYAGEEWRTVDLTRTDDEGHYSLSHRFGFAGAVEVETVAHPHGEQRTESAVLSYTILQAQNPALTIQSNTAAPPATEPPTLGAPPLAATPASAAPTTISGVAGKAANQTITLLARNQAGHFTPVATVIADATDAYSFTVDPTQSTIYEVSAGRERSTQVRVQGS
jgi:hypothetical protein